MNNITIIIPAYNEQARIGETLRTYYQFFNKLKAEGKHDFKLLVVLNGCRDRTAQVVTDAINVLGNEIRMIELQESGKGLAIIVGFKDALAHSSDYIGFVDADMATEPRYFYELYKVMNGYDGVIASRYMPTSQVYPPRPWIKQWGRKLVYNPLVWLLFGLSYADVQCGAKLFKRFVIQSIIDELHEGQWAFDVELLYKVKKHGFTVIEIPTVWFDKEGSKLQVFKSGLHMLRSLFVLRKNC